METSNRQPKLILLAFKNMYKIISKVLLFRENFTQLFSRVFPLNRIEPDPRMRSSVNLFE